MSFIGRAPLLPVLGRRGPIPSFAWDFTRANSLPAIATFTRASTKARFVDGLLATVASGAPAFDYHQTTNAALGLLVDEARTNVALWNRDLTNAAWTPSNVTPLKNITGIDGVANSASRITATANAGTITQAITLASSARFLTVYVYRITGTGTLEMSTDGGATYTDITTASATFVQKSIPTQTLANPEVRFRIGTSGDAFAIDYVQNENGTFATSSIATTTAAVTRAADVCSILTSAFPFNASEGTMFVEFQSITGSVATGANRGLIFLDNDAGSTDNRVGILTLTDTNVIGRATFGSNAANLATAGTIAAGVNRAAIAYQAGANGGALVLNGGTVSLSSPSGALAGVTTLRLANTQTEADFGNMWIRRAAYYPRRLPNATLQALTAA